MGISRRDTLILAMLINVALLSILFATATYWQEKPLAKSPATQSDGSLASAPLEISQTIPSRTKMESSKLPIDEMDEALKNYVTSAHSGTFSQETLLQASSDVSSVPLTQKSKERKPSIEYCEIVVKKGDTLDKIAQANGVTLAEIVEMNQLQGQQVRVGQILKVPSIAHSVASLERYKSVSQTASLGTPSSPAPHSSHNLPKKQDQAVQPEYYTIRKGDNPWKIARQYHVKFEDLLKMNGLDEEKAKNLQVGDKIRVR